MSRYILSRWGIGPADAKLLRDRGVATALVLRDVELGWARKMITVVGERLVLELRGINCLKLETAPPPRKSITCSRSFPKAINSLGEAREAVAAFVTRAGERLRQGGLAASVVTVFARTGRFSAGPHYANSATIEVVSHRLDAGVATRGAGRAGATFIGRGVATGGRACCWAA